MMKRRLLHGFMTVASLALLIGCGPVTVGAPGPDTSPTTSPTPTQTGSFSITADQGAIDVHQGWMNTVNLTVTAEDGYEGTLTISPPADAGWGFTLDKTSVTLTATETSVPVAVTIENMHSEAAGVLTAMGSGSADLTFTVADATDNATATVSTTITDYTFFKLGLGVPGDQEDLFHNSYEARVNSVVFFVGMDATAGGANPPGSSGGVGTFDHILHSSNLGIHQDQGGSVMINGLAFSPNNGNMGIDMYQANPDLSGFTTAYTATPAQNTFYCHNHQNVIDPDTGVVANLHANNAVDLPTLVIIP